MHLRLVPTMVTFNGLGRHYDVILRLSRWMAQLSEISFSVYKHVPVFSILLQRRIVWRWTCIDQVTLYLFTTVPWNILTNREKN